LCRLGDARGLRRGLALGQLGLGGDLDRGGVHGWPRLCATTHARNGGEVVALFARS
jgi:hypothetical protein